MKRNSFDLADIKINSNNIIPYFSDGSWSLYQLISHILDQSGPAHVKISSFSISEPALRSFLQEKENERILSLSLLFDFTIPKRKFDIMLFAHDVFSEIRLCNNHSKAILIYNDHHNICVIGSQNLTPNPRLECGAVFTGKEHFKFYDDMFDTFFSDAIPFDPYDND